MDRDYSKLNLILLGNGQEWLTYCWKGALERYPNVHLYNSFLPDFGSKILNKLCRLVFSKKASFLPIKRFFYPRIANAIGLSKGETTQIVFYDYGVLSRELSFVEFIRENYPNVLLVYRFTNVVSISRAKISGYLPQLKGLFDLILAFDKLDESEYGFKYLPLVYTSSIKKDAELKYDLFYVGNAKDRLNILLEIFEKANNEGLKCLFYIFGVEPDRQRFSDIIHFNERVDYSFVLDCISRSKALVDVIQGNSTGFTIKSCEAVCLDRKLISTNSALKKIPFFNDNNILIYNGNQSLSEFISKGFIPYTKDDKHYFSAEQLVDCIIDISMHQYGK